MGRSCGVGKKMGGNGSGMPPAPRHESIQWLSLRSMLYRSLACLARLASAAEYFCPLLTAQRSPPSLPVANSGSHPREYADFFRRCHRFSSARETPAQHSHCMDRLPSSRLRFVCQGTFQCNELPPSCLPSFIYLDAPNAIPVRSHSSLVLRQCLTCPTI